MCLFPKYKLSTLDIIYLKQNKPPVQFNSSVINMGQMHKPCNHCADQDREHFYSCPEVPSFPCVISPALSPAASDLLSVTRD